MKPRSACGGALSVNRPVKQDAMPLTERSRAERALDAYSVTTNVQSLEWPAAGSRIRTARLTSGLDEHEIARRLGITLYSYGDLEAYDGEAFNVATLRHLAMLGRILSVEPKVLLLGSEVSTIQRTITFDAIREGLAQRIADTGVTAEQLGDEIGFLIEAVLESADNLWDYDAEALYCICKVLGIDWVAALPDLAAAQHLKQD